MTLSGAGSTLVAPLMFAWSLAYTASTVDYAAVGSGGGITDITQKTVDFAASDAPLSPPQRAAIGSPGVLTFPESAGGVVPIYNLPGVSEVLRFTGQVLAAIYLGAITNWNNTALQAINPGVSLPHATIVVVHRSDGSGTTFVWSSFLSAENSTWNSTIGHSTTISWPVGIGERGSAGVTTAVQTTPDSIGYVDVNYALTYSVAYGAVQNPSGNFVLANITNIESAISDSNVVFPSPTGDWYNVSVLNAPGDNDYPVATLTFVLVYQDLNAAYPGYTLAKAENLVNFLWWIVTSPGQSYAAPLYYAPLAPSTVTFDESAISSMTFDGLEVPRCAATSTQFNYSVTFTEAGLPKNTTWYVNTSGAESRTSTGNQIGFTEPNGTYTYTVATTDKSYRSPGGQFIVNGSAIAMPVTFSLVTYPVVFSESGLPSGTNWSVTVIGLAPYESSTTTLTFPASNGTYSFSVGSISGYTENLSAGSITVNGAAVKLSIAFSAASGTATLLGLPAAEGYVLIGAVVVVLVGIILAVVLVRRRRRPPPNVTTPQPGMEHPPGQA